MTKTILTLRSLWFWLLVFLILILVSWKLVGNAKIVNKGQYTRKPGGLTKTLNTGRGQNRKIKSIRIAKGVGFIAHVIRDKNRTKTNNSNSGTAGIIL